jgi:hypothetical protein
MKKIIWRLMVLAAIGFGMAACDNGGDDGDIFTGTWKSDDQEMRFVAKNGSFTQYMIQTGAPAGPDGQGTDNTWDKPNVKGTYTLSGNTVNVTITHANMRESEADKDNWVAYAQLDSEYKGNIPQTVTGTISGNTFTVSLGEDSAIFTKAK